VVVTSLDEVSFKLGELSNGQAALLARATQHDAETAEIRALLNDIKNKIDPLAKDVVWMKPHVKHYSGVRRFSGWVHSLVVGVASIFGGAVGTWFLRKYGGS
jgi:hypothetical protein